LLHSLKRVKRRAGKTIGAVSQEFLVMIVQDEQQRELEIVTQWQGMMRFFFKYIYLMQKLIEFSLQL
jgi:hypothetical protein